MSNFRQVHRSARSWARQRSPARMHIEAPAASRTAPLQAADEPAAHISVRSTPRLERGRERLLVEASSAVGAGGCTLAWLFGNPLQMSLTHSTKPTRRGACGGLGESV